MQYLKCDAEGCDHVEYHQQINVSLVDKPCPKCQSNLLTQSDYDDWAKFEELLSQLPDDGTETEVINFHLHNGILRWTE